MPLYEYRCESCGEAEERLESMSAPERHGCPKCGAEHGMARQLSRVAFSFAGGGWYAQGYGDGKPGKTETKTEASTEAKTETKTETKATGCGGGCACHPA